MKSMELDIFDELKRVHEKVDTHQKKSDEFYIEMRTNISLALWKLDRLQESVLKTELKLENVETRLTKAEEKLEANEKKVIYTLSWVVFIGFLVIILFAQ